MGFVKRNLAFVLMMAVALLAVAGLSFLFVQKTGEAKERKEEAKKQIETLQGAQSLAFTVNPTNLDQAVKNRKAADGAFGAFLSGLAERSAFAVETVRGVECKSRLKEECAELKALLDKAGIGVSTEAADFSFGEVFNSPAIPADADAAQLLKQMKVIREIVQMVLKMKPGTSFLRVTRLTSPVDAARPAKDLYRTQSFELIVQGGNPSIQDLVNQIHRSERGVFILRRFEMQSVDQAPGGVISPVSTGDGRTGVSTPRAGTTAVPNALMGTMAPPVPTVPGGAAAAAGAKTGPAMLGSKSEERVAFQPHEVRAILTLDMVEFEAKKSAGEK